MLPVVLLSTLAALAADPTPAARGSEVFDVVVAGASGSRTVSSLLVLEVSVAGAHRVFRAARTEGSWEEAGKRTAFDSDALTRADPWFLRLQHHVASIPAVVALDARGAPSALLEQEDWQRAVRQRIYDDDLPLQALTVAESLIDPVGLVRELRRDFPGRPPPGDWQREERVAGLASTRIETCEVRRRLRRTLWTCEGRVDGPTDGPARLHDVTTRTVIEADRRGLVQLESAWSGTLVMLGPDGAGVLDRPIAERRLVRRRSAAPVGEVQ